MSAIEVPQVCPECRSDETTWRIDGAGHCYDLALECDSCGFTGEASETFAFTARPELYAFGSDDAGRLAGIAATPEAGGDDG